MESSQIIVLGMHRSGTSAITGALAQMGIWVGDDDELTARSWENPKGFFERRDARVICDDLLHRSGADWWKVTDFDHDNVPHQAMRDNAKAITELVGKLDEHGSWAIKEPRLCFLLPIFHASLSHPVIIHIIREPTEVARSLRHRNGIPTQAGLALWEYYNLAAVKNSSGMTRISTNYRDLVEQPERELARIGKALEAAGVSGIDVTNAISAVDPKLYRERNTDDDAVLMYPGQKRVWKALESGKYEDLPAQPCAASRLTLEQYEPEEVERLARQSEVAQQLHASQKSAAGLEDKYEKAVSRIDELKEMLSADRKKSADNISGLQKKLEASNTQSAVLDGKYGDALKRINELKTLLDEERTKSAERIAGLDGKYRDALTRIEELKSQLQQSNGRLTESTKRVDELKKTLENERVRGMERVTHAETKYGEALDRIAELDQSKRTAKMRSDENAKLTQLVKDLRATVAKRDDRVTGLEAQQQRLNREVAELSRILIQTRAALDNAQAASNDQHHQLLHREQQVAALEQALKDIRSSTSWRISAPYRFLGRLFGRK